MTYPLEDLLMSKVLIAKIQQPTKKFVYTNYLLLANGARDYKMSLVCE